MANKIYHIGQKVYNPNKPINYSGSKIYTDDLIGIDNYHIIKLGINTLPGIKFVFNNTKNGNNDQFPEIEIGRTGFFELDLSNLEMSISSIQTHIENAKDINESYCYIDFVYYKDGE